MVIGLLALLGSLAVHLPVYEVLGFLSESLSKKDAQGPAPKNTIEFDLAALPPPPVVKAPRRIPLHRVPPEQKTVPTPQEKPKMTKAEVKPPEPKAKKEKAL